MTVDLNHFYLTLDSETYQAVRASEFLTREFAPFEQRTTQRNDISYTGIYFYGRNTYFEFFEAGSGGRAAAREAGASAIAFGVDTPGASPRVAQAWRKLGFGRTTLVTRRTETAEPPWFHMTTPEETRSGLFSTWLMEYHEHFLAQWYPDLPPAVRSIRRADILDRYVARIGMHDRRDQFLLKEVDEIDLALAPAERERFRRLLEAVGRRCRTEAGSVICVAPRLRLTLALAGAGSAGIRRVGMSLQRTHGGRREHRFGRSRLLLEDGPVATWWF